MKERPILFSGEMVRAILEGKKTQTRRVIKPQPPEGFRQWGRCINGNAAWTDHPFQGEKGNIVHAKGPYGEPGDRLWVRETWALVPRTAYAGSAGVQQTLRPDDNHDAAIYRAGWDRVPPGQWRPSIFMPRWASRIMLEVTGVRVERLHDITEDDAKAEGVWTDSTDMRMLSSATKNHVGAFARLWNEINERRGYGWGSNPWCWVVEFKRIEV